MKIAILSDIHGNTNAFDAVLKNIKENACEKILVLGDYILAGYDPNYSLSKLIELKDEFKIEMILGNTDLFFLNYSEDLFNYILKHAPSMAYALKHDIDKVDKKNLDFLRTLSETKKLEIDNVKIFMCHGSPRKIDEGITTNFDVNCLNAMVKDMDSDIIFTGHTHVPTGFQLDCNKTVVNVGSVGRPMNFEKMATYAILDTRGNEAEFSLRHQLVEFDNKLVQKEIIKRGFIECETIAKMFNKEN